MIVVRPKMMKIKDGDDETSYSRGRRGKTLTEEEKSFTGKK